VRELRQRTSLYDDVKPRVDMYVYVPIREYMYQFIIGFI